MKFEGTLGSNESAGGIADEDRNLGDPAQPGGTTSHMYHRIQSRGELCVQRGLRQTAERGQGFQTCWYIGGGICMYRAAATFVARIHGSQQVTNLRPADLTHHQPVR